MRIEVNNDAARLRQPVAPIKCINDVNFTQQFDVAIREGHKSFEQALSMCDDCGDSMMSCRCNPGEG